MRLLNKIIQPIILMNLLTTFLLSLYCFALSEDGENIPMKNTNINIASFARVVTSDPNRMDGARAGRLEEFHAEDVFLTKEILPDADGFYIVPKYEKGESFIGLEWAERRVLREISIRFANLEKAPSPDNVQVQYWSSQGRMDSWGDIGQTPWQGKWEKLGGKLSRMTTNGL